MQLSTPKEGVLYDSKRSRSEPLFLDGVHASNIVNGILVVSSPREKTSAKPLHTREKEQILVFS